MIKKKYFYSRAVSFGPYLGAKVRTKQEKSWDLLDKILTSHSEILMTIIQIVKTPKIVSLSNKLAQI